MLVLIPRDSLWLLDLLTSWYKCSYGQSHPRREDSWVIKPQLLWCISRVGEPSTILLIKPLYKALLKLGTGSKHDSLTVLNVWKIFKEVGTKMGGKITCIFELFSSVNICNSPLKWYRLKTHMYSVIMWPRAWKSDPKFLGNVTLGVCIWNLLELSDLEQILCEPQYYCLIIGSAKLSQDEVRKCLDSDHYKEKPESMPTTRFSKLTWRQMASILYV